MTLLTCNVLGFGTCIVLAFVILFEFMIGFKKAIPDCYGNFGGMLIVISLFMLASFDRFDFPV